jgi:hypothetical protein
MNFINVETGLVVIEGTLLLCLLVMVVCVRRIRTRSVGKEPPLRDSDQIKIWARESEAICQGLSKNLEEKEFQSYSWDKYEKGDPSFLFELILRNTPTILSTSFAFFITNMLVSP